MYGTVDLFIEAFGLSEATQLSNLDSPNAEGVNSIPIVRALTDGAAQIDSYIGRIYTLPLTVIPQVLIPYALDIARYRLDRIRDRENVRARYSDALKWLESVRDGKCHLGVDTIANTLVPISVHVGNVTFGGERRGGLLDMRGF